LEWQIVNNKAWITRVLPFPTVALLMSSLVAGVATAQELAPRAYWPTPVGTRLLLTGYSLSTGDIVTDASLPVSGVDSRIHSALVGYQQTFDVMGRTASARIELPYVIGTTKGIAFGQPAQRDVNGIGDIALTFSINLLGAPAMDREAFIAMLRDPSPILGASLRIVAPTGEYDDERYINIGTNRWSTRLQLGYIHPLGNRWGLEISAGAWLFGTNDDFVGMRRTQDPIFAGEAHLIRLLRSGTWLSLDANYYAGGRSYLDDERNADFQRNSRFGLSASWPFKKRHIIKASFSTGITTESGGDYEIFSLTYSYALKPPGSAG
jgi:hypothetical protein